MPTGIATSYDLTVGVKIDMDENIYMISAMDSPFITGRDADGLSILGRVPTTQTKVEWLEDEILTPRSQLSAAAVTADVQIAVQTGHRLRFSTGDLLRIGAARQPEIVRVTGYSITTANMLLVSRSFGAVAAGLFTSGDAVVSVGTALTEGSAAEDARTRDRDPFFNITQIFGPTRMTMSRTEQIIQKYGVSDEWSYQLMNRMTENVISREQAILYGERIDETPVKQRSMGGLAYYLVSNVDTTTTQLTEIRVAEKQQVVYNKGGRVDRLAANPASLKDLDSITETNRVRVTLDDPRRGRFAVTTVITRYGPVTVVENRWLAPTQAILFNREGVVRRPMTPLIYEALAKTRDGDDGHIVCEESLEVKGEDHMVWMDGLVYTA